MWKLLGAMLCWSGYAGWTTRVVADCSWSEYAAALPLVNVCGARLHLVTHSMGWWALISHPESGRGEKGCWMCNRSVLFQQKGALGKETSRGWNRICSETGDLNRWGWRLILVCVSCSTDTHNRVPKTVYREKSEKRFLIKKYLVWEYKTFLPPDKLIFAIQIKHSCCLAVLVVIKIDWRKLLQSLTQNAVLGFFFPGVLTLIVSEVSVPYK